MENEELFVISKETAEKELSKLMDYYEISLDTIEDEEVKRMIQAGYDRLVKAVRLGRLQIKIENGLQVIQKLRSTGTEIVYREIDGEAKAAMDGHDPKAYNKRAHALMGSLSGLGEAAIKKLKGVDLSLCEVLGLIFLSV